MIILKKKIISLICTIIIGLLSFYIFLPAINIHSLGFWIFVMYLIMIYSVIAFSSSIGELLKYNSLNIKKNGFKFFFKGFSIDGILITLVDTLELFVRPFTLALRLFANILAGEILISTCLGMIAFALPLPFMLFELFVAVIQALVFTLLSLTYISMAIQEE